MGNGIEGWASTIGREVELPEPSRCFECGNGYDRGYMNMDGVWIPRFEDGIFSIPASAVARIVMEELMKNR